MSLGFGSVSGTVLPAGSRCAREISASVSTGSAAGRHPAAAGKEEVEEAEESTTTWAGQGAGYTGWRIGGPLLPSSAWFLMLAVCLPCIPIRVSLRVRLQR